MLATAAPAIDYVNVGETVVATQPGHGHTLTWHRSDGNVYLDDEARVCGSRLSEHAFRVHAATYFGRLDAVERDDSPLPHSSRGPREERSVWGVGWRIACACGHYRTPWRATTAEAHEAFATHLAAAAG